MVSVYYKIIRLLLFICLPISFPCSGNAQISVNEKPFSFNTININDGLSQNSAISIAQDSIGYLWIATQDGLNKYNGRSFKYYDKQFEDITRPTFSKLGKVYVDQQNRLWIITNSGKLELYNASTDGFKPVPTFKDVSSIFQDKNLNTYVGTYGNGLFKIDAKSKDTLQVLKTTDKQLTIYDFIETHSTLIIAASGKIIELNQEQPYSERQVIAHNNANFSTLEKDENGNIWLGSYGQGLFYKKKTPLRL